MAVVRITIPTEFTLINREWKVVWLTDAKEKLITKGWGEDDVKLWGYCDYENATIYIKKSRNKDHMMHTFLHELCHAVLYSLGWADRFDDEESMVDALGGTLHQWLKTKKGSLV